MIRYIHKEGFKIIGDYPCPQDGITTEEMQHDDPELIALYNPPETYSQKRRKSLANGGYGTVEEQLEIIGEGGPSALAIFQAHIAKIKANHPK